MTQPTGRRNQNVGKHGERLAESVLNGLGVEEIGKIETPQVRTPYFCPYRKAVVPGVFRVRFGEKVAGDRTGVLKGGAGVRIEVKTVEGDRLMYSELKDHQHASLQRFADLGGLSLLVWVSDNGVWVLQYPIPDFVPRSSLSVSKAYDWDQYTRKRINELIK